MAGVDTVRGIGYQQAQAVVEALDLLDDPEAAALRVEGVDDIVDVEVLTTAGTTRSAKQIKVRSDEYTWGKGELISVLRRWAALPAADDADFEFVTDGRLGPTGQQVEAALRAAAKGSPEELALLLGQSPDSAACRRLRRARVRRDPVPIGALLLRAERQVASMLPAPGTAEDVRAESRAAVDRLFRLLMERAGHPDAQARIADREEIASALGVPARLAPLHRWPGALRDAYIAAAAQLSLESVIVPQLAGVASEPLVRRVLEAADAEPVSTLLDHRPAAILTGRTGTGKTTACRVLVGEGAAAGRVVLMAHAEAYLPGRLGALAADALSAVMDEALPVVTGGQAIADPAVTLVIDGVSEVPEAVRDALAEDLRSPVAAGRGAAIVLVGRDVAAIRAVLPSSVAPTVFTVADLGDECRMDLAHRLLVDVAPPAAPADLPSSAGVVVARVEQALKDAAGNPLLFAMAVTLIGAGVPFTSRATLYEAFVEQLAARTGATDVIPTARALGVVYASLLNEGRRYADPYEWRALVERAVASGSLGVDSARVDRSSRRSGVVTTIGYAQMVVPIHDSFADYLAGTAHAGGLVDLPTTLRQADEQRVMFTGEIAGVDADLAERVANDLPFLVVRLASHDRRRPVEGTPDEVAAVLRHLLPVGAPAGAALWRHDRRVIAFSSGTGTSRWLDDDAGRSLLDRVPSVASTSGPVDIAARLWRRFLRDRLSTPRTLAPPRPASIEQACRTLSEHAKAEVTALGQLIHDVSPPKGADGIAAQLGPTGLTARVGPRDATSFSEWPVAYVHTAEVDVRPAVCDQSDAPRPVRWGSSSLEFLVSDAPETTAAKRLISAINRLVGEEWL